MKTGAGTLVCSTATFTSSGWAPGGLIIDTNALVLLPAFGGCTLAGIGATVTPTAGCAYTFNLTGAAPFVGSLSLCNTQIAATGAKCVVTLSGQTRSGMSYANAGSGSSATVQATANLSGVEYQIANGKQCPNEMKDGPYSDGKVTGVVTLKVTKVH